MNHTEARDWLHDYVDGDLDEATRQRVQQHLDDCTQCRDEARYFQELKQRAADMQRAVAPPRDLWPQIAAAFAADTGLKTGDQTADLAPTPAPASRASTARRSRRFRLPWRMAPASLAAAVVAAVLLTASVLWFRLPGESGIAPSTTPTVAERTFGDAVAPGATSAAATVHALAAETRPVTSERLALAVFTGPRSNGDVRAELNRGIALFDGAIDELTAAWLADPGNVSLAHQLATAFQNRARLERRADRLSVLL
jgi:anti-sigma factor RsiW